MKITNRRLTATFLLTVALGAGAQAAPITGSINIGAGSIVNLDKTLKTVIFTPGSPANNALVSFSSGNLASIAPTFTFGSYKNFTYSPLSVINPIWTFGAATFDLTQVTYIDDAGPGLVLLGTGLMKAAGYDDTLGSWSFSADSATGTNFSWSSTAAATNVPDGGTSMSLLGLSLLGVAGAAKKLRKK